MSKRSMKIKEQLRESDQELLRIQRELRIASGAVLEAQHFALNKSGEVGSFSYGWEA